MRNRVFTIAVILLLGTLGIGLATATAAGASVAVAGIKLTSGKPVKGTVSSPAGVSYTFTAVTGKHLTLAITHPVTSRGRLQLNAYDASGADDCQAVFSTTPVECDFTPSAAQAGTTTVVISPYDSGATGSFTLTYATDVTGQLANATAQKGRLKFEGQHADYTMTAVAGQHVTFNITNPVAAGGRLQMNVYDASGADDCQAVFSTTPVECDFTPSAAQAGTTTVVISAYDSGATGSFTVTYATDVTGALTSGTPVTSTIQFEGQHADYTFTAVTGHHVTFQITNPMVTARMQLNVYDASGADDCSLVFSTSPTECDFTPGAAQAGPTTVVISAYDSGTTGTFTLTYAKDVTGKLTSGTPKPGALKIEGQHADYTFKAVAGVPVTVVITKPLVTGRMQMNIYDASGADECGQVFSTAPVQCAFTPGTAQAGTTTVVISPYDSGATGSFTTTYTAG